MPPQLFVYPLLVPPQLLVFPGLTTARPSLERHTGAPRHGRTPRGERNAPAQSGLPAPRSPRHRRDASEVRGRADESRRIETLDGAPARGGRPVPPSDVPRPRTCRSGGRFAAAGARGRQTVRRSRDGGGFRRRCGGPIGHRGTRLSLSPSPPRRNRPSTSRRAIATGSPAPRRDSHLIWQGDHAGIRADERAPRCRCAHRPRTRTDRDEPNAPNRQGRREGTDP